MYLALRDLRRSWGRFALVGSVIALVSLMAALLSGLANGLVDDGISGLRQLPAQSFVFQQGAQNTFSRSTLTADQLAPWQAVAGVTASPVGVSFVNVKRSDGTTVDLALFGVPSDSFLASRPEARAALAGPAGLVLSHAFEAQGIKVGDRLTVVGVDRSLPVLGFTYAGSYGHVDMGFTSLQTWQELLYGSDARGRFSAIALGGSPAAIAHAAADIDAAVGTDTVTKQQAYSGSPGYQGETSTMALIRVFLLLISALIVGSFFVVWTLQRSRQIAILKALGASATYVARDAVGQLVVLLAATSAGGAAAYGLGWLIARTAVPFRLTAGSAGASLGLLVVTGLLACLLSVRRVTSVDPSVALRAAD